LYIGINTVTAEALMKAAISGVDWIVKTSLLKGGDAL